MTMPVVQHLMFHHNTPSPMSKAQCRISHAESLMPNCHTGEAQFPQAKAHCLVPHVQFLIPNVKSPMPNSQCQIVNQPPMRNAQSPTPNAQCPMRNALCATLNDVFPMRNALCQMFKARNPMPIANAESPMPKAQPTLNAQWPMTMPVAQHLMFHHNTPSPISKAQSRISHAESLAIPVMHNSHRPKPTA